MTPSNQVNRTSQATPSDQATHVAEVRLWGRTIGAVAGQPENPTATFQYAPEFVDSGIQIAPLSLPLDSLPVALPDLPRRAFHGLPGLLADSMPGPFGQALMDVERRLSENAPEGGNVVHQLLRIGARGRGALEYHPVDGAAALDPERDMSREPTRDPLDVSALADVAFAVIADPAADPLPPAATDRSRLRQLFDLGVGTGGSRPKVPVAWNPETDEVGPDAWTGTPGFESWLLTFDGTLTTPRDDLEGHGGRAAIQKAYSTMAEAAGVSVPDAHVLERDGRRHLLVRRFDRVGGGAKVHTLSLSGMAHVSHDRPGSCAYETAFQVMHRLELDKGQVEELFRRMVFNVVARNQDDHVGSIHFLMDRQGRWSLAPASGLTYAHHPSGVWTSRHRMSLNGKRQGFTRADLIAAGRRALLKRGRASAIHEQVREAVQGWSEYAEAAGVEAHHMAHIAGAHRVELPRE